MKIKDIIKEYISLNNIKEYNMRDIDRIVAFCLNIEKDIFVINKDNIDIDDCEKKCIIEKLDKFYISKYPLQYIIGMQYFYNEKYIVNSSVLIPRQDTEILVEEATKYINTNKLKTCIDLCTGSGCVGISIANNSNIEKVYLVDISKDSLDIAKKNIIINKCKNKCKTFQSNYLNDIEKKIKADIIVSNPPYIKTNDVAKLDEYVKKEPIIALDGGIDGISAYIEILKQSKNHLMDNGYILFEIGFDQNNQLKELISKYDCYEYIETKKDYESNDRVVVCRFHQK